MKRKNFVFSSGVYKEIILLSQSLGYVTIPFRSIPKYNTSDKVLLLRHDIDVSLKFAAEMARLESDLGAKSTFFVMLRSPAYNLFSRHSFRLLNEIMDLGHEIGLHFDAAHPIVKGQDLSVCVQKEKEMLEDLVQQEISSVSFHQPSSEILDKDLFFEGLRNTYNRQQMDGWYYLSDSNRVWKEHDAFSVFEVNQYDRIQMLIHPMWWVCDLPDVESVWDETILTNFHGMQEQFLATEGAYGPKRKFSIS